MHKPTLIDPSQFPRLLFQTHELRDSSQNTAHLCTQSSGASSYWHFAHSA